MQLASAGCVAAVPICAELAKDVAAERSRLAGEVASYRFYPVLRVGLSYRF